MSRSQRRWWNAFRVEFKLQKRFVLMLALITGVGMLSTAVLFWLFYQRIMDQIVGGDLPFLYSPEEMAAISARIPGIQSIMIEWMIILGGINIVLIVLAVFLVVHRLSGPVYRFKRAFEHVANGDLTGSVDLRKGDDFQELAESINQMVFRFQIMIMAIRDNLQALKQAEVDNDAQAAETARIGLGEALSYFETVEVPQNQNEDNRR